jgi:hypothetical protein
VPFEFVGFVEINNSFLTPSLFSVNIERPPRV